MSKKLLILSLLFLSSTVFCASMLPDNSGEWMFTAEVTDGIGKDITILQTSDTSLSGEMDFEEAVAIWLGIDESDLFFYGKNEIDDDGITTATEGYPLDVAITYDDGVDLGGTWKTLDSEGEPYGHAIDFYSVKAGNQFALYYENPAAVEGTWNTTDINFVAGNNPFISHFSAYTTAPVPEPGTLLLLAFGLLGFGFLKRKK